jgi:2-polyprenyl-6-hydroxyphenyl methylase/3-demethylubiquinone-9 3-methyltransferase
MSAPASPEHESRNGGPRSTLDPQEVARFQAIASEWWDANGKFRPLHQIGPARLTFIRDQILTHIGRPLAGASPLKDIAILDIGCGGGLVSEPLARLGARVTGIDPGPETIAAAQSHAAAQNLAIDYRAATAESLVEAGEVFDVVLCLEVVEHVPDVAAFVNLISRLVRPGGLLVMSTINRTLKSFGLAIVAAEYILGWLPRGTHQWDRFVKPDELSEHLKRAGLAVRATQGLSYDPLRDHWHLSIDTDVNYMIAAEIPAT